jgi:type IV fimbrial biogenesis protein FimT
MASPRTHNGPARHARGLSLIEALMTLAVTAIALGAALPGFEAARERRHLDGVAAQLETDLQFTRSLAVARQRTLRISYGADAEGSCYVIHDGGADDCRCGSAGPVCRGATQALRHVHLGPDAAVGLSANVRSMAFDADKGTVTPTGTVRIVGRDGRAVHQVVNLMGRVRSCSPAPALAGYRTC